MSVDSLTTAPSEEEPVSNEELLELFEEQQARIDELEDELEHEREKRQELEETVQTFERFTGPAFAKVVNTIANGGEIEATDDVPAFNDVEILPTAGKAADALQERSERLSSVEDTVRRHESEIDQNQSISADSQAEHWQRVVEKAQNVQGMSKHTLADNWVIMYKEDIAAAIEPGEKRAGQLINEWTDTGSKKYQQGTKKQPYKPPASSRNGNAQKKAIKIDLDVWGDA